MNIRSKQGEPWVELAGASELEDWGEAQRISYNQNNRQMEKYTFYVAAFDYLADSNIPGDYHEFGCHRARTFRMALTEARRQNLRSMSQQNEE